MSAKEAAAALARETGIADVAAVDVRELAARGLVRIAIHGWPPTADLYDLDGFAAVAELRQVVDARRAWRAASLDRWDAAQALGVSLEEFDALAARRGLRPGRAGRYRRGEIMRLRR